MATGRSYEVRETLGRSLTPLPEAGRMDLGRIELDAEFVDNLSSLVAGGEQAAVLNVVVDLHPADLALRLKLAEALAAEQRYEDALQEALSVVQADRINFGDAARTIMVDIFHLLPDDSELTREYRRKLSSALY